MVPALTVQSNTPILPPMNVFRGDHSKTLLDNIANQPDLSTFYKLITERKYLINALSQADANLTVFAPTNAALDKLKSVPDDETLTQVRDLAF